MGINEYKNARDNCRVDTTMATQSQCGGVVIELPRS
jgi:hypothetical protein